MPNRLRTQERRRTTLRAHPHMINIPSRLRMEGWLPHLEMMPGHPVQFLGGVRRLTLVLSRHGE